MRRLCLALLLISATLPASAQERQFAVTLGESQWNTMAKVLAKSRDWSFEESSPIMTAIGTQIGQALAGDAQQKASDASELKSLRDQVTALKAEIEKLKNPPPEAPQ